jgi:hypothetical protein
MPLDTDFIAAEATLQAIEKILVESPHGERAWIADELDSFHDRLLEKQTLLKKASGAESEAGESVD